MEEGDKKVKIIDKRHFTPDGVKRELCEEEKSAPGADVEIKLPKGEKPMDEPPADDSFKELVLFLAHNALAALCQLPNSPGGKNEPNLDAAYAMIEWLGSIEKKSKNNLAKEEKGLLDEYLYKLKMLYCQARQGEKA